MRSNLDEGELRRRVLLKVATAPSVLLPAVAGASLLIGSWGFGSPFGFFSFVGLAGVLTGLGALATRWIFGVDRVTREVIDEAERDRVRAAEKELDRLDRQLRRDRDPRTQKYLRSLRDMFERFREDNPSESGVSTAQHAEITAHAERLVTSCVASLERSIVLWKTSKSLHTEDAKRSALETRDRVLAEVDSSIDHLARIFDGVHMLSLGDDGHGKMASIRSELDASLNVARRVEERMQEIRESLDGHTPGRESDSEAPQAIERDRE